MLHDLNIYIVGKLLLAALLGGAVGLERELSGKPAGLRTNMLIAIGAALFTIISYQMAGTVGGDHTRIAAQIIPGIGFIGAGVVIRERGTIIGITSAATIFVVASIGMAVGAGQEVTATFSALLLLGCLVILGHIEERFGLHFRLMNIRLVVPRTGNPAERVRGIFDDLRISVRRWQTHEADDGTLVEFDAELTSTQERQLHARHRPLSTHVEARPIRAVTPL